MSHCGRGDYFCMWVTLQEEKIPWNLNFAILLMTNSLNLISAYLKLFVNISMIACIIEIQKWKFANVWFIEIDDA